MIRRLISSAAGKSCELDPVPSWVIQKFADELSPSVAALFNASMSSSSFPTTQKTAFITPVLKKATLDPYDLGNYRPISNLTFLSKLLERAAYEQIVGYLDRYQLLPELQSAYRKYRSTETAKIRAMSDITRRQTPPSPFSTSAPRLTRSTIAFYSIDSGTTTGSGDWSFSGSSLISQDAVNSCSSTGSPQRLYQSPPVCRRGPSWGRSSSYPTRPKSLPSFSIRASKCTRSPTTYKYMDRWLRTVLLI